MNDIIELDNNKEYTLKTAEGQQNLRDFIELYNSRNENNDPLFKKIGIDEALAMTNINEYIQNNGRIAEIIRESIEIGLTTKNFKTNTIFTFARSALKKAGCNSILRIQLENYIKFRLNLTDKTINTTAEDEKFKNITSFSIGSDIFYFDMVTDEQLDGEVLQEYLSYKNTKKLGA